MMTSDLMTVGVELAALGMGTVFAFLTMLVIVTNLMSSLVSRFTDGEADGRLPSSNLASNQPAGHVIAAIGEAVRRYRDDHSK